MADRDLCLAEQQVLPDGSLRFSCQCGGEGCPFDPRSSKLAAVRDRFARDVEAARRG